VVSRPEYLHMGGPLHGLVQSVPVSEDVAVYQTLAPGGAFFAYTMVQYRRQRIAMFGKLFDVFVSSDYGTAELAIDGWELFVSPFGKMIYDKQH
jgi:hypothetical protein